MSERYNIKETESKWRTRWNDDDAFAVAEDESKPKYYVLEMFPYPSGRIHVGHVRNYTLGDVVARYKKAKGFNVLHPMGWDAFGLPAENAAIERGEHPKKWTHENIASMREQLKSMGLSIDWSREFATCDPEYYAHEQRMFLKFLDKGIAYRKESIVNWDPVDNTVLANEQVIDGCGWRTGAPVERRKLNQWSLKITDYAEELLGDLKDLDRWPEKVRIMQENWIGKSVGLQFKWNIVENGQQVEVYTTRPDTLFGASFLALAPDHPMTKQLCEGKDGFDDFIAECQAHGTSEAAIEKAEKIGFDTGFTATHPLLGRDVPVYIANFILMDYGTGAIFGVPAHDQRDYDFATKYSLDILPVVSPDGDAGFALDGEAFTGEGSLINSQWLNGMSIEDAKAEVIKRCEADDTGFGTTQYRLRDWGVSRQRYWGCPIPIINCNDCGAVAVPEQDLPVVLPTDVEFDGVGSPIKKMPEWSKTTCPKCGGDAERETDTFDTFMESSWYYARFASSGHEGGMLDDRAKYWGSVDHYVGGEEHAILHLLYARFFHKVMRDEGMVESDEPFENLLSLGMVLKDGSKMSKSAGDAGDPQHLLDAHGADAVRMAMMFSAPPEQSFEWSENGVESAERWLRTKLWNTTTEHLARGGIAPLDVSKLSDQQKEVRRVVHETIARASDDYGKRLNFNTVVSGVMSLMNHVTKFDDQSEQGRAVLQEALGIAVLVLSPITPHICHELWQMLRGEEITEALWPEVDEQALAKTSVEMVVQVNGKVRAKFETAPDGNADDIEAEARNLENVAKFIVDKTVRKVIVVPNKLVNFVVS